MLIQSRPDQSESPQNATPAEVKFTHCTICKVSSAKGKVQLVFETEISDAALLEHVKAAVGMSAGLVDITLVERSETGEDEKTRSAKKRKN
jgi:hypothetical protein